ncbi:hypothetical protein Hanom_Chr04g00368441 [Helianthus anomalus]
MYCKRDYLFGERIQSSLQTWTNVLLMVYIILRGFQMVLIDETLGIQLQMYHLSLKYITSFMLN